MLADRQGILEQYPSRIEEVGADYIALAMPMRKGYPVVILNNDVFLGRITIDGQSYQFQCRLAGKRMSPIPVWLAALPEKITKIQQRSFVRIDASLDVDLRILPRSDNENVSEIKRLTTKDISGGGTQLVSRESIELGRKLSMVISFPDGDIIEVIGEVVRNEQPQPDRKLFWIGVRFMDIEERDRSKIIRFVFKRQLERRQKGF